MHWTIARYGESQCGALFEKVRQKVEYFLEEGDESDAPADREFLGLMQR